MWNISEITVADFFCGCGGMTTGIEAAGIRTKVAANHWNQAIETHNTNYPQVEHYLVDIHAAHARDFPHTIGFAGSPECTNHTLAKGKKRKNLNQSDMFDEDALPDEAEERSRCTMWDPVRMAEYHKYEFVVLENVVDVRFWSEWDEWLRAWDRLGYHVQLVYFNSMFAWPTPQSRDRIYIVCTRKGNPLPDLRFTPRAWCVSCGKDIESVQSWKNPLKRHGKYGKSGQYLYRCPVCAGEVQPYYYCAANAIDWSIPTQRIGDRKRPLEPKTVERIQLGLAKFRGTDPFMADMTKTTDRLRSVMGEAFPTQTATNGLGLVNPPPFLLNLSYLDSQHSSYVYSPQGPFPTQTARQSVAMVTPPFVYSMNHAEMQAAEVLGSPMPTRTTYDDTALVVTPPFMIDHLYEYRLREMSQPVSTIVAEGNHQSVVIPPAFLAELRNHADGASLSEPLSTLCAGGLHHALVTPGAQRPFLVNHIQGFRTNDMIDPLNTVCGMHHQSIVMPAWLMTYYSNGKLYPVSDPCSTQTTVEREALVVGGGSDDDGGDIDYEDCGFRMLEPGEIKLAMAFPRTYKILGTRRAQVKQAGNACTPPVVKMIMQRVLQSLA